MRMCKSQWSEAFRGGEPLILFDVDVDVDVVDEDEDIRNDLETFCGVQCLVAATICTSSRLPVTAPF